MRSAIVLAALVVAGLAAPAAHAAKRHAQLAVAVIPFAGKGAGGGDTKDAVDVALSGSARIVDVENVSADLGKAGAKAFEPGKLASILAARGIDVLVRGARAGSHVVVTAYAKDGKPRLTKALAPGLEPDAAAQAVAAALVPALASWKTLKPLTGDDSARSDDAVASDDSAVDAGDARATVVLASERQGRGKAKPGALDFDGGAGEAAAPTPAPKKHHASIDDDDAVAPAVDARAARAESTDSSEAAPAPKKHHASIDDDDASTSTAPARAASAEESDAERAPTHHETVDDAVAAVAAGPKQSEALRHSFAISGALDAGGWHYGFDGGAAKSSASAAFYPGQSLFVDAFPLAFAGIHWLGVDGDVGASQATIDLGTAVNPGQFVSQQLRYSAAVKLRYTFDNGVGLGARAGYRFLTAGANSQAAEVGGIAKSITVAPGYYARTLAVGADLFVPFLVADHRVELDARAEALPLATYVEVPDNPGTQSTAFGWHGLVAMRADVVSGFFIEDRLETTGLDVHYSGTGDRQALDGNTVTALQGGNVINMTGAFSIGVGYMF